MQQTPGAAPPIGWWLKEADARIDAAFDAALEGTGVDRRGWQVLASLARAPVPRAGLAEALAPFEAAGAVDTLLDAMVSSGWVVESASRLALTSDGESVQQALATRVEAVRRRMAEALPAEDYQALVLLLQRLVDGLPPATRATTPTPAPTGVRQLRLVVAVDDHDAVVRFYRDVLGMPEQEASTGPGQARVTILGAGRATLEVANRAQQQHIDDVEVGRRVAGDLRVALQVADASDAAHRAEAAGASTVAPPTRTPWDSLNARLDAPGPLRITLFQELGSIPG